MLSNKIKKIPESGTVKFTPVIQKLKKQGKNIISLAIGEPDFDAADEIKQATIDAIKNNYTKYSDVSGVFELKKAICNSLKKENSLDYGPENIIVTNGSKHGLFTIFQAICNKGDEVIILLPAWPTYKEQVKCAGAIPIFSKTINNQPDLENINSLITKKTKAIIINSPNNPTGAVYSKECLLKIGEMAVRHNFFIISDEAYKDLVYEASHFSIASLGKKIKKKTISVFSFSKSYCMTGFRVGYCAGEEYIIRAMKRLQSHITGNVCSFAQYGALKALSLNPGFKKNLAHEFKKRRDLCYRLFGTVFKCIKPEGAFYLFGDATKVIKKLGLKNSEELVDFFIKKAGVVFIPGSVFGAENHIRIAYTADREKIKEAFYRIKKSLD